MLRSTWETGGSCTTPGLGEGVPLEKVAKLSGSRSVHKILNQRIFATELVEQYAAMSSPQIQL